MKEQSILIKKLLRQLSFYFIVPLIILSFAYLPDRVNLSGEWKLNESKSELGELGSRMAARTIKINQTNDAISISIIAISPDGEDVTTTETLRFNGKESETTLFGNQKKRSVAKWSDDGQTLVISYSILFEGNGHINEFKGTQTWNLTKEGSLAMITVSSSPRGETTTKAVYDK